MALNKNMIRDFGVSVVKFYRHPINEWFQQTASLSDGQYRAYHSICSLIFQNQGPITLHENWIAGISNQSVSCFRRHLDELVKRELVEVSDDGTARTVGVEWCRAELEHIARKAAAAVKAGRASAASRSLGRGGPSDEQGVGTAPPTNGNEAAAVRARTPDYEDDMPF